MTWLRHAALMLCLPAAVLAVGCAAPCDQYCNDSADYIEACLANGSSQEWKDASAAGSDGWAVWGTTSKDEYVADCQTDFDAQLGASEEPKGLEELCSDDANRYAQHLSMGQCNDLP